MMGAPKWPPNPPTLVAPRRSRRAPRLTRSTPRRSRVQAADTVTRATPAPRHVSRPTECGALRRPRLDRRQRLGVPEIGRDRRDHDPSFNGQKIDADERYAHPRIDDDPFVEHAIEHVDDAGI